MRGSRDEEKERLRTLAEKQVQEFVNAGGTIQQLQPGESGLYLDLKYGEGRRRGITIINEGLRAKAGRRSKVRADDGLGEAGEG